MAAPWMIAAQCDDGGWPIALMVSVAIVCVTAATLSAWELMYHPRQNRPPARGSELPDETPATEIEG